MSELPPGWEIADIASVTSHVTDGTHAPPPDEPLGVPLLSAKDINDGTILPKGTRLVSEEYFHAELERTHLTENDVLLTIVGTIGRSTVVPANPRFALQRSVAILKPLGVIPRFLSYYLRSPEAVGFYQENARGTAQKGLYLRELKTLPVPVPPEAEQRRIVAAIEERFSCLDAGERLLSDVRRRLASLRDSVLARALSGSWPMEPLECALLKLRNGVFISRPAERPPGIAIFRISAVRPLALDAEDVRYASVEAADVEGFFVDEGDLLFTRYSGNPEYVGACARVSALPRPTLHPDKLIRGVVDRSRFDPAFLELACSTGVTREAIRARRKTTAGQVGIAGGQLRTVPVPVVPLDEQRQIVADVARQRSLIEALFAEVDAALQRSKALRRAILARAFAGKLVPQDPADEPASVLLERIAAERAAAAPVRRTDRGRPRRAATPGSPR